MAFSADELRVLRRALAQALRSPAPDPPALHGVWPAAHGDGTSAQTAWVEDVRAYVRLSEAIDEADGESGRQRAFLVEDLVRYRQTLPGSAPGYLERLREALRAGYLPVADDLAALRGLLTQPCSPAERARRAELSARCHRLAEEAVEARLNVQAALATRPRSGGRAVCSATADRSGLVGLPGPAATKAAQSAGEQRGAQARTTTLLGLPRSSSSSAGGCPRSSCRSTPAGVAGVAVPTPNEVWRQRPAERPSVPASGRRPTASRALATG
ncbi:hypothetical protein [Allostreptomyces psammosilenae]|uniref:Uncharacterized protein n=1 Tax=Allostreptomyces psammosilenae TaxID=1892865 RepID=A0A852ZTJ0_9ACTN|nr:hypothetical protein [Allostreptomyces psammosilenae]NYI05726.1 hypothetical protein [Allostreptomyces psammosilenae]